MTEENILGFKCDECGSTELRYQKYVKCIAPVTLGKNGHIEYGLSEISEDDYLCVNNGFVCMNCKGVIRHCGVNIETEEELIDYLFMDTILREKQQKEYEDNLNAQIEAQEMKENEQEYDYAEEY